MVIKSDHSFSAHSLEVRTVVSDAEIQQLQFEIAEAVAERITRLIVAELMPVVRDSIDLKAVTDRAQQAVLDAIAKRAANLVLGEYTHEHSS